jgi:hypothetical protein
MNEINLPREDTNFCRYLNPARSYSSTNVEIDSEEASAGDIYDFATKAFMDTLGDLSHLSDANITLLMRHSRYW